MVEEEAAAGAVVADVEPAAAAVDGAVVWANARDGTIAVATPSISPVVMNFIV
jgi:hypothetical protein